MASVLTRVGLVVGSLLVAILALEVGLRLFWDGYYLRERRSYARPHPDRGWENLPGARVDFGKPEFSTRVSHNSLGFRGAEIEPAQPGRLRILALGDSFTYGVGVEDDETWSAVLARLEPRFEVLNAGVNNYGTTQELHLLREWAPRLEPDLVVLAFFWNDVPDSYKRDFPAFHLENGALHYPAPRSAQDPLLVPWPKRYRTLRHSYAYRFLFDRVELLAWRIELALGRPVDDPLTLHAGEVEPAWALVGASLREMARLAGESGARFVIAVIPDQVQVEPAGAVHLLGFHESDVLVQERMRVFGAESGIPVLDLLPALRVAAGEDARLYYPRDRHLTARGQAVVAERILAELRALDFVPRPGVAN